MQVGYLNLQADQDEHTAMNNATYVMNIVKGQKALPSDGFHDRECKTGCPEGSL